MLWRAEEADEKMSCVDMTRIDFFILAEQPQKRTGGQNDDFWGEM